MLKRILVGAALVLLPAAVLAQSSAGGGGGGGSSSVSVTNFPATQPVSGTFWQSTQPVSATALPLPSGAATAANQNVTAAGTSASNAQAVQGATNGVPLPSALFQAGSAVALANPVWGTTVATSAATNATPSVSSSAAVAFAVKASAGNLYGFSFTQGTTAGFLALLNAATGPAGGAAISPVECIPVAANGYIARRQDVPDRYTNGFVLVSTSSCTTFTPVTPVLMTAVFL